MRNFHFFPGSCHPQPDELLSSWVRRVANNHGMSLVDFWQKILPVGYYKGKVKTHHCFDIDLYPVDQALDTLSLRTFSSIDQINETIFGYDYKIFSIQKVRCSRFDKYYRWLLNFNKNDIKYRAIGPSFCVGCLRKDGKRPLMRKPWRFSFNVACLDCGLLLNDRCPICNTTINLQGYFLLTKELNICSSCDYDLTLTPTQPAHPLILEQQQKLQDLFNLQHELGRNYTQLYFETLRNIIAILIAFARFPDRIETPGPFLCEDHLDLEYNNSFENCPIDIRARFLYQSMLLLSGDPEEFAKSKRIFTKQYKVRYYPDHRFLIHRLQDLPKDWMQNWSATV